MRTNLIRTALLAACLGAAVSASADPTTTPGQYQPGGMQGAEQQTAPGATYDQSNQPAYPSNPSSGRMRLVRPGVWADQTPPSGVDSTAYTQCHGLSANEYWDCVNSHDGGGGQ